jgi:hypothetical protein
MASSTLASMHEAISRFSSPQLADFASALVDLGAVSRSQQWALDHGPGAGRAYEPIPGPGDAGLTLYVPAGAGALVAALLEQSGCVFESSSRVLAVAAPTDRGSRRKFRLTLRAERWPASDAVGVIAELLLEWDELLRSAAARPEAYSRLRFPTQLCRPVSLDDFCTHLLVGWDDSRQRDACKADVLELGGLVHARFVSGAFASRPPVSDAALTLAVLLGDDARADTVSVDARPPVANLTGWSRSGLLELFADVLTRPELLDVAVRLDRPRPARPVRLPASPVVGPATGTAAHLSARGGGLGSL